jgi:YbbR domain-containing protein
VSAKEGIRDQIRAAFVENLGLKVLSLLCAVALYVVIHGPETAQRAFTVSVLSIMPPDSANRTLITPLPTEVGITLRGPRTQLDELHADDIGALRLDLRSGHDGKIELEPTMFHVPAGLTVEQIIPSSIRVRWDDVISKTVPVQVPRTGEPLPGTAVKGTITTEPAEVRARGPRSVLDVMQLARANPYDVSGLAEGDHTIKLPLDKPPQLVTFDVDQVAATVHITKQLVSKTFPKLKVEVIGPPRATTRPGTVTIAITGTAEDVGAVTPDSIVPRVEPKANGDDITKAGNDNLPVLVDVPKGITVQVDPPKVVVTW